MQRHGQVGSHPLILLELRAQQDVCYSMPALQLPLPCVYVKTVLFMVSYGLICSSLRFRFHYITEDLCEYLRNFVAYCIFLNLFLTIGAICKSNMCPSMTFYSNHK